jgi:hypothetical protein
MSPNGTAITQRFTDRIAIDQHVRLGRGDRHAQLCI